MKRSFVTRAGVAAIAVVLVASFPGCNKKSGSGIVDEVANSENAKNAVFKEAYELNLDFVPTTVVSAGDDQILYFSNYISDDSYAYGGPVGYAEPELTDVEVPLTADPAEPEDREGAPMKPDEGADVDDEAPVDGEDADEGEGEDEPYDGPSYTCGWAFGDKEGNVGRTVKYAPKVGDANLNDFQYLENGNIALIENHWIEQNGEYVVEQNVVILSKDGKELSRVTLQGSLEYMMESLRILSDGSAVAGTEEGIQFFAKDGKKTGKIPLGAEEYLQNILLAADGTVYAVIGTEKGTEAKPIDLNSKSLGEGIEFPSNDFYNLTVAPGHDVYSMTQSGILAYDFASKEAVQILNYLDSDMNRETVYGIGIIDATTVYVCEENLDKDDGSVKTGIYKKVDPKDVKDKTIITIGGMYIGDTALTKQIVKFNKQSSEYRIRTINYDQFSTPDDYSAGEKQFRNDVLTKSGPDIVLLSGLSNPGIYMKKKVFADLYPMMSGAGINKDDYLQNVLDAGSIDGRLYAFIPKFTVSGYVMKQSLIPGKNSVSIPEIQAMEQQYDLVGKSVPYAYRENIIYTAIYTSGKSFYDADTGKCNFDSDDFVNLLKWANNFPSYSDDTDELYDYVDESQLFRANKLLIKDYGIASFRGFNVEEKEVFGEDTAFIAFPNSEGLEGGVLYDEMALAISSSSKHKDAAFDFIRYFMSEDYQMPEENGYYVYGFPVLKKAFDAAGKMAQERPYWTDPETGEKEYYDDSYYDEKTGKEIIITPIDDARLGYIKDRIQKCNTLRSYDEEIINLVNEEAAAYFNGQKSAEEVAKIIQSRVSIYVRENQ